MRGSVYKYKGKRGDTWCIRYELPTAKGQPRNQRHESLPGLNKAQAEAYLAEILGKLRKGTYTEPSRITLGEFLDQWLDRSRARISPTTWESYSKYIAGHIRPALGDTLLIALHPAAIQAYYDRLVRTKRLAPKSIRNLHGILRGALSSAVRLRLIERNPAEGLDLPHVPDPGIKTASEVDIIRLLEAMSGSKYQLPVIIAYSTGARRGEVLALRWEDYNSKSDKRTGEVAGELIIRHSLAQTRGAIVMKETKTGKVAPVPIPSSLVGILDAERRRQHKRAAEKGYALDGWICTDPNTGERLTPQGLSRAFYRITRRIGVDVTFHGLRHTHVTNLLESGVPLKVVSERVRHSNVATTADRYGHVTATMQQQAVDITEDRLFRIINQVVDDIHRPDRPDDGSEGGAEIVRIFPKHPES